MAFQSVLATTGNPALCCMTEFLLWLTQSSTRRFQMTSAKLSSSVMLQYKVSNIHFRLLSQKLNGSSTKDSIVKTPLYDTYNTWLRQSCARLMYYATHCFH